MKDNMIFKNMVDNLETKMLKNLNKMCKSAQYGYPGIGMEIGPAG